ncbi:hypothetical protein FRC00_014605, partial [Tulasnella sp. 408]
PEPHHRQNSDTTVRNNAANAGPYDRRRPSAAAPPNQNEWPAPPSSFAPSSSSGYAGSFRPHTASTISTASSTASSGSSSGRSFARQTTFTAPPGIPPNPDQTKPLEWENIFHPSFLPEISHFDQDWNVSVSNSGVAPNVPRLDLRHGFGRTFDSGSPDLFTGLYTDHILFSQNSKVPPSKKLLVYDVKAQKSSQIKVRYDTAGLGPHGKYLLYRFTDEMALYDVVNSRTIKTASLRNLSR